MGWVKRFLILFAVGVLAVFYIGYRLSTKVMREGPTPKGRVEKTAPPPEVGSAPGLGRTDGASDDGTWEEPGSPEPAGLPAAAGLEGAASSDGSQPPPDPQILNPGFEKIEKGELAEAEEFFQEHLRLYPIDPEGHYGLGLVYRFEEEIEPSIEEFAKTLLLNPAHLQAKMQVAEMLTFQLKEDLETAEKFYQEVLEQVPQERSAVNGLATVYLQSGRTDEAIGLWENLREESPDEEALAKNLAEAYYVKGSQEAQGGNAEGAREWIERARDLNPDDPTYEEKWKELTVSP